MSALLDHLGVTSAAVVGVCLGGQVALQLATLQPDRVSALVLLSSSLRGVPPTAALRVFGETEDRVLAQIPGRPFARAGLGRPPFCPGATGKVAALLLSPGLLTRATPTRRQ